MNRTVPSTECSGSRELAVYATGLVQKCTVFQFCLVLYLQPYLDAITSALEIVKMMASGPREKMELGGKREGGEHEMTSEEMSAAAFAA